MALLYSFYVLVRQIRPGFTIEQAAVVDFGFTQLEANFDPSIVRHLGQDARHLGHLAPALVPPVLQARPHGP